MQMTIFIFQPIPIAWVVTENKKWKSYETLLEYLKKSFSNLNILEILNNFQTGLKKAVNNVFPAARVLSCNFHYEQVCKNF